MKVNIDNLRKLCRKHFKLILIIAAAIVLALVAGYFIRHIGTSRRTFYFEVTGTQKIERETRFVSGRTLQTPLEIYLSELLLGPQLRRARPLFTLGTSLEFCIEKGDGLYIGLSEDAVFQDSGAVEITRGIELLKKNVTKNFPRFKNIEIFINGISIDSKN